VQGITQVIGSDGTVQNIAEFRAAGVDGWLNVGGTVVPSDDGARPHAQRYNIFPIIHNVSGCKCTCTHTAMGEGKLFDCCPG